MKKIVLILIACTAIFTAQSLFADTESDIRAGLSYFAEIWDDGELDAIASYYHQDFVQVTANGVVPLQRLLDDMKSIGRNGGDRGELSLSDIVVRKLGSDHAMAYGRQSLKFKDGSSLDSWFSTVYVKTPFGWKAILTRN